MYCSSSLFFFIPSPSFMKRKTHICFPSHLYNRDSLSLLFCVILLSSLSSFFTIYLLYLLLFVHHISYNLFLLEVNPVTSVITTLDQLTVSLLAQFLCKVSLSLANHSLAQDFCEHSYSGFCRYRNNLSTSLLIVICNLVGLNVLYHLPLFCQTGGSSPKSRLVELIFCFFRPSPDVKQSAVHVVPLVAHKLNTLTLVICFSQNIFHCIYNHMLLSVIIRDTAAYQS